jgi:hypothetical protein
MTDDWKYKEFNELYEKFKQTNNEDEKLGIAVKIILLLLIK